MKLTHGTRFATSGFLLIINTNRGNTGYYKSENPDLKHSFYNSCLKNLDWIRISMTTRFSTK